MYDTQKGRKDIPEKELFEFKKTHCDMLYKAIETDEVDKFKAYIHKKAILLPKNHTKAINW